MREIKFRAWDKIHKDIKKVAVIDWVTETILLWNKRGNVRITIHRTFETVELMQHTGLRDDNGKEIYEGDIIRIRETEFDDWRMYLIEYHGDRDYPAFDTEPSIDCDSNGLSYATACCELEVIGNIFENPELLEVPR